MKKTILGALLGCLMSLVLVGCGETTTINVNVENSGELSGTTLGIDSLIEIGDGLWYDSTTKIVYWWNGYMGSANCVTAPTAYYAPNGLPYRYNPETNTFEEIQLDNSSTN